MRIHFAYVKWLDACGDNTEQYYEDLERKDRRGLLCHSAGIVIKNDKDGIILSLQSWIGDTTQKWIGRGTLSIPRKYMVGKPRVIKI